MISCSKIQASMLLYHAIHLVHKSLGERNGNPLQYSCLGSPMNRGAWWATVHGISKKQTRLSNLTIAISSLVLPCFLLLLSVLQNYLCNHHSLNSAIYQTPLRNSSIFPGLSQTQKYTVTSAKHTYLYLHMGPNQSKPFQFPSSPTLPIPCNICKMAGKYRQSNLMVDKYDCVYHRMLQKGDEIWALKTD